MKNNKIAMMRERVIDLTMAVLPDDLCEMNKAINSLKHCFVEVCNEHNMDSHHRCLFGSSSYSNVHTSKVSIKDKM